MTCNKIKKIYDNLNNLSISMQSSFDIAKLNTPNIILSALSPYRS